MTKDAGGGWDEALRRLKLVDGSDVAHETPAGACWYCRRPIDRDREAWRRLPQELLAHQDCDTLFMDGPIAVPLRKDYAAADAGSYFEDLASFVRDLHPTNRYSYPTESRLQPAMDELVDAMYQRAVADLLGAADNPWRRRDESDGSYLTRIILDEDEEEED